MKTQLKKISDLEEEYFELYEKINSKLEDEKTEDELACLIRLIEIIKK